MKRTPTVHRCAATRYEVDVRRVGVPKGNEPRRLRSRTHRESSPRGPTFLAQAAEPHLKRTLWAGQVLAHTSETPCSSVAPDSIESVRSGLSVHRGRVSYARCRTSATSHSR